MNRKEIVGLFALIVAVLTFLFGDNLYQQITGHSVFATTTVLPFNDEFSTSTLASKWSWVSEDPSHWSLTSNPDHLRIVTQRGDVFDATNNLNNLLLQRPPRGDFTIITLLSIYPDTHAQQGGLLIYQDDSNYVRLTRGYLFSSNQIEFVLEQNDIPTVQQIEEASPRIYLAISKYGTTFAASFSRDGNIWTKIGEYTNVTLRNIQIGISAWNGDLDANEIPVDFDFFRVTTN